MGQALYRLPGKIGARPAVGVPNQNDKPAYRCVLLPHLQDLPGQPSLQSSRPTARGTRPWRPAHKRCARPLCKSVIGLAVATAARNPLPSPVEW